MHTEAGIATHASPTGHFADMKPIEHFQHCPRCSSALQSSDKKPGSITCGNCAFVYFFNPSVAAAGIILRADGKGLFIRRAKEPGKGMLAMPGGFIDFDETAENALRREIREEVGVELDGIRFLCSAVNHYAYKDVTYQVLDLFFTARVIEPAKAVALDDVESVLWLDPHLLKPEELAFASRRRALSEFLKP